jgi:hypothetical protein
MLACLPVLGSEQPANPDMLAAMTVGDMSSGSSTPVLAPAGLLFDRWRPACPGRSHIGSSGLAPRHCVFLPPSGRARGLTALPFLALST